MAETFPVEFGSYRLLRKIAQGGMAEIFLAQDQKGDICAIKRILPHLAHEESFIRMFIDEARIVSHIRHQNVAQVYDQGKHAGYYYIAMEFVQGHSLLALSERARSMKIPLPRGLLGYIVAELLAGLSCAHAARDAKGRHLGIVHRDVTPQNVFVSWGGRVILGDFGVAHIQAYGEVNPGIQMGKIGYLSPEAATAEEVDHRADIFAAGIILWELLTDTRLFDQGTDEQLMMAIAEARVPRPRTLEPGLAKGLEGLIMKALAKKPKDRFENAEEMLYELEPFWSKQLGNPHALAAFMSGIFRQEVRDWRAKRAQSSIASKPAQ